MTGFLGPIFVHSDIGRALLVMKRKGISVNSKNICLSLLNFLISLANNDQTGIVLPAFNYDFGKTRTFRPFFDPIQVGAFPEWVRVNCDFNRSEVPFFSTLSMQNSKQNNNQVINPFGDQSSFAQLAKDDGTIVLLGTNISRMTFIHYVEEISGKPCYRYDKNFRGKIFIDEDNSYSCDVCMHVRPMGVHLDYDWKRLNEELIFEGILQMDEDASELKYIQARKLIEYWGNKISSDPLYLLDQQSRKNFKGATSNGTTRISIEKYEEYQ